MKKQIKKVLLSTCAVVAVSALSVAFVSAGPIENAAAEGYTFGAAEMQMVEGASIRMDEVTGIRFRAGVGAELKATVEADETQSFGFVIAPTSYFVASQALESATGDYINDIAKLDQAVYQQPIILECTPVQDSNGWYIQGTIATVKYENTNLSFTGLGFVKTETADAVSYQYAALAGSNGLATYGRSVAQVAANGLDAGMDDTAGIAQGIIEDSAEVFYNNNNLGEYAEYVAPLTQTATEAKFAELEALYGAFNALPERVQTYLSTNYAEKFAAVKEDYDTLNALLSKENPLFEGFESFNLDTRESVSYKIGDNGGAGFALTTEATELPQGGSGTALKITGTAWSGINANTNIIPEAGRRYAISVNILNLSDSGETFYMNVFADGGNTPTNSTSAWIEGGANGKLGFSFKAATVTKDFKVQLFSTNNGKEFSYTIDNFEIWAGDPLQEDFEKVTLNGSEGYGSFTIYSDNNASLSLTTDANKVPEGGSGTALLVEKENAAGLWPGAKFHVGKDLTVGAEYTFTALVRSISDVDRIYMKLEGNNDGAYSDNVGLEVGATGTLSKTITVSQSNPDILIFFTGAADKSHAFTIDNVTVTEKAQAVITNRPANNTIDMTKTTEYTLSYALIGGAQANSVSWTSSATDVATIDENGKITVKNTGTTTITLTAGEYTNSFNVTVTRPATGTLLASENFDNNFAVTANGYDFSGTSGNGLTFSANAWEVKLVDNLPTNGSGNALFWNPWDGWWSGLGINGLSIESGKTYEIRFDAKLISHTKGMGIRLFVQYYGADGALKNGEYDLVDNPSLGFTQVGESISFIYRFTTPADCVSISTWLSVEESGTTQIAIDNFEFYAI